VAGTDAHATTRGPAPELAEPVVGDRAHGARPLVSTLGFPRIGPGRELKSALERHWSGRLDRAGLAAEASAIRRASWERQRALGVDHVPSNDFSLYDHVLDTAVMVGAVPERYGPASAHGSAAGLEGYFAMARGGVVDGRQLAALEMTKWFDTNYHYIVPEIARGQRFVLDAGKPLTELAEAEAAGIATRPVVLGPISFLLLALRSDAPGALGRLLPGLVDVYGELLVALAAAGATWVQLDEPVLATDLDAEIRASFAGAYGVLADAAGPLQLLVATYFAGLRDNLATALELPVAAVHLDLVAAPEQLEPALDALGPGRALSLGLVDGRNVWRADLDGVLARLRRARERLGADRVLVGPSCSLLHLPVDASVESELDPELRSWLAFATQRVEELDLCARAVADPEGAAAELATARAVREGRTGSTRVVDPAVRRRTAACTPEMQHRSAPYAARRAAQDARLGLPLLPTTTIGSFPQTPEVRSLRSRYRRGEIAAPQYEAELQRRTAEIVSFQEQIGLDVLVHGELERTDMVEYFAEHLAGCAVTTAGWVQSYGSRCVKPPVVFGDVHRRAPITVGWFRHAQGCSTKPVKGMLTGPLTLLAWSFVRDDEPLEVTACQLALAVRDELADLEAAGAVVVQVDEPGLRELLPLHVADRARYLGWAVAAFGLATGVAAEATQVHTHMCYAEFADVLDAIVAFDADVISLESSRSAMAPLADFGAASYPNAIGPGVFDIHSARVPSTEEMVRLLHRALEVLEPSQVWVNPDCGLKTRRPEEVEPALRNMVAAARAVRDELVGDGRTG
jgi:5-methyltetrahydropteroyltriglutamate--homocysteine methyltransferase